MRAGSAHAGVVWTSCLVLPCASLPLSGSAQTVGTESFEPGLAPSCLMQPPSPNVGCRGRWWEHQRDLPSLELRPAGPPSPLRSGSRVGPYDRDRDDRPGPRSPLESWEEDPEDVAGPGGEVTAPAASEVCSRCLALADENQRLRRCLHQAFDAAASEAATTTLLWESIADLRRQMRSFSPVTSEAGVGQIFLAEESEAIRLMRDPRLVLRALRYHEERLDAIVNCLP